jgi:phage FluMu gp28-like protein
MKSKDPYFLPYQRRWLADDSPLKIIEKSRQIGMTFIDAYDSVKKVIRRGSCLDVWVSSRDEEQAKLYLEDCARWADIMQEDAHSAGEIGIEPKKDFSAYVLEFKSGRRIYSLSSNPNALAGKRGHVKFDEFALHQDQRLLFRVAKPVTQWGGQLSIISTHRGAHTVFNQLIRQIREAANPMGWSLHSVPLQKAVEEGLVEKIQEKQRLAQNQGRGDQAGPSASTLGREEWLARIRRECIDEEQWLQEYCCVPLEGASAFITHEMLTACEAPELRLLTFDELAAYCESGVFPSRHEDGQENEDAEETAAKESPLLTRDTRQMTLFLGLDVARKHDLCVIDVGEKIGDVVWDRLRIELRGKSFSEIEAELYGLLKLRQVKRACIDATGLGAQLAERAEERFGWKVEPITFTAAIKEELAFGLRGDFEDQRVRIVRDEALSADLRGLKKQVSASGNIRFEGESGESHCDRFWAKALRQHAARHKVRVSAAVG